MATQPYDPPFVTADEFLAMNLGDHKAELENGVIRLMAGGTARHAEVQINISSALREKLRGSGCKPYSSDMATRTGKATIRYPDVTVFCGRSADDADRKFFDDPRAIFEVLSAGTARTDLRVKLEEYQKLQTLDTIVFVDAVSERVRVVQRTGPTGFSDVSHTQPFDIPLPSLGIALLHDEIFAQD